MCIRDRVYAVRRGCMESQREGKHYTMLAAPLLGMSGHGQFRTVHSAFALRDECPCETVAPEVLGLVQGYVSAADQHGNAVTGLPQSRADRAGDVVRGCNPQSLEYVFGIRPGAAGENGDELVSSEARERVSEP